jgi:hypothetical protein
MNYDLTSVHDLINAVFVMVCARLDGNADYFDEESAKLIERHGRAAFDAAHVLACHALSLGMAEIGVPQPCTSGAVANAGVGTSSGRA